MNTLVRELLSQCKIAEIPDIPDGETSVVISRAGATVGVELNKAYVIELEDYLMYPSSSFEFYTAWDNGRVPGSKYIRVSVTQIRGKMFQFDGVGTDYDNIASNEVYMGYWLPLKGINIRKRL